MKKTSSVMYLEIEKNSIVSVFTILKVTFKEKSHLKLIHVYLEKQNWLF